MVAPIGAHASALMALRTQSLEAYGIYPRGLIVREHHPLMKVDESPTRTLAKSKHEERALAVAAEFVSA
jgi:hypothetical protein